MPISKKIHKLQSRYPLLGPIIYISSIQYFVIQYIVSLKFRPDFSITYYTISDLGNTVCASYDKRMVCSPLHPLMNISFVLLGLIILLGSWLIHFQFNKPERITVGFILFSLGGIGAILVGLFPENTIYFLHGLGSFLPFLFGNIALVVLGLSLNVSKFLRIYTILSGTIALIAFCFYITHHYLGIDEGGVERLMAFPQTIWMIVFGVYLLFNHDNQEILKKN